MYQSKPSFKPGVSESSSTCSNWTCFPVMARVAWTRCALDSGTSQSGSVVGTSAYSCYFPSHLVSGSLSRSMKYRIIAYPNKRGIRNGDTTDTIYYVEDDAHGDAELLKIQVSIVVNVSDIPDALELIVIQTTVL